MPNHPLTETAERVWPEPKSRSAKVSASRSVVFLLHRAPYPLDKGEKIRAYHELRSLARRGHRVHLIAFVDTDRDARSAAALNVWCASMRLVRRRTRLATLKAGLRIITGGPLSLGAFRSARMATAVRETLARHAPDVLFAYSGAMGQYIPGEWWDRTVFDIVDADSEKWRVLAPTAGWLRRWVFRLEARRLAAYEGSIVRRARTTVVSTCAERELLYRDHGRSIEPRVRVIANAVDVDAPDPTPQAPVGDAPTLGACPALVFAGAMDYGPNVDAVCYFVNEILPLVQARTPVVFWIVGRNPGPEVRRLAGSSGVRVTGYVDDVRPYLTAAAVAVVPIRIARGIQTKLLEAMAVGCAVVCSPEVNAAVAATPGEHLLLGNSPRAFADAVLRLLGDPALRASLGTGARQFAIERYAPEILEREIDDAICAVGAAQQSVSAGDSRVAVQR
jgi:sugar transferase (PEP-CTERM/EpsH1 system associated)